MKEPSRIEPLEPRIAPASVSITYKDVDGDLVKITASKPGKVAPPLDLADLSFHLDHIRQLTLTDAGFNDASIVLTVTKKRSGNGLANLGLIDASGVDLNKVIVKGELGRIIAGDEATMNDSGLNLLQVRSMGTLGLVTQGDGGSLRSSITGKLGALKVAGDFTDATVEVKGGATDETAVDGQIGSIVIGGNLTGGPIDLSGSIASTGAMGHVHIRGDVIGGLGSASGAILSLGTMGNVRVGGDLVGGAGDFSGQVSGEKGMGDVRIGGRLTGGGGDRSGRVVADVTMGDVRIAGDLIGGAGLLSGQIGGKVVGDVSIDGSVIGGGGPGSGQIGSVEAMGDVYIGGDLIGGSVSGTASLTDSGEIFSYGRIASVTIGGSLIAGSNASTGRVLRCGAIVAGDDLGPVKISGNIVGNQSNRALIIAEGQEVKPSTGIDTAIASVTVGGDMRFAFILAGFDADQAPVNADASIGRVSVGRNWVASGLVAGVATGPDDMFGTFDDTRQTGGNPALIAQIASISIKGTVTGSYSLGDNFGMVAEQIGKLTLGNRTAGPSLTTIGRFTDDVWLLEVSRLG